MSICQHANGSTGRRARSLRLARYMQESGMQITDRMKNYSGKNVFRHIDPLESVIFPALPWIQKKKEQGASGVDP